MYNIESNPVAGIKGNSRIYIENRVGQRKIEHKPQWQTSGHADFV